MVILSNFNSDLIPICSKLLRDHDNLWIKRKRQIDTQTIFDCLTESTIKNTGISTCIQLSQKFSHVSMLKARNKIDHNLFYTINKLLHQSSYLHNHIYAIDGSKVPVMQGFKSKYGYQTRTCDKVVQRPAKRPLAMLSALTGIQSDTIVNYTITKHFNERRCISDLINGLSIKDTVILDRGYYSSQIYSLFYKRNVHCIMRLKKDANKSARSFFKSKRNDYFTNILYDGHFIPIRYIKYHINGSTFMMATTLFHKTVKQIKDMYKLRWRVELSFKRLKSHLNINKIHAKSEQLWKQDMQRRILLDTITRQCQIRSYTSYITKKKTRSYRYILIGLWNRSNTNVCNISTFNEYNESMIDAIT